MNHEDEVKFIVKSKEKKRATQVSETGHQCQIGKYAWSIVKRVGYGVVCELCLCQESGSGTESTEENSGLEEETSGGGGGER